MTIKFKNYVIELRSSIMAFYITSTYYIDII